MHVLADYPAYADRLAIFRFDSMSLQLPRQPHCLQVLCCGVQGTPSSQQSTEAVRQPRQMAALQMLQELQGLTRESLTPRARQKIQEKLQCLEDITRQSMAHS